MRAVPIFIFGTGKISKRLIDDDSGNSFGFGYEVVIIRGDPAIHHGDRYAAAIQTSVDLP